MADSTLGPWWKKAGAQQLAVHPVYTTMDGRNAINGVFRNAARAVVSRQAKKAARNRRRKPQKLLVEGPRAAAGEASEGEIPTEDEHENVSVEVTVERQSKLGQTRSASSLWSKLRGQVVRKPESSDSEESDDLQEPALDIQLESSAEEAEPHSNDAHFSQVVRRVTKHQDRLARPHIEEVQWREFRRGEAAVLSTRESTGPRPKIAGRSRDNGREVQAAEDESVLVDQKALAAQVVAHTIMQIPPRKLRYHHHQRLSRRDRNRIASDTKARHLQELEDDCAEHLQAVRSRLLAIEHDLRMLHRASQPPEDLGLLG